MDKTFEELLEEDDLWQSFRYFLSHGKATESYFNGDKKGTYKINTSSLQKKDWNMVAEIMELDGFSVYFTDPNTKNTLIEETLVKIKAMDPQDRNSQSNNACVSCFGEVLMDVLPEDLKRKSEKYGEILVPLSAGLSEKATRSVQGGVFISNFLPLYAFSLYVQDNNT